MAYTTVIKSINHITHDVLRITAAKPVGIQFYPGQAVDVAIHKPKWENEWRSFTFTSLPDDDYLEWTIKTYPQHQGVTHALETLTAGDELLIGEVFGAIHYKGKGLFIAGGAGITPFIAILKKLKKDDAIDGNRLLYANKKKEDIIDEEVFRKLLGNHFVNVLSDEQRNGYEHGFVTAELIQQLAEDGMQFYYLCGPPPMMEAVNKALQTLNVPTERIVQEAF